MDPNGRKPGVGGEDPFDRLGLEPCFDLTDDAIESAFLSRLAQVHPDRAGEDASHDAAVLTEARAALLDPESRANALLDRLGGADDRALPDGFLQSMLELRSEIEEDLASGDAGVRERWERWARERRIGHQERAAELLAAASGDPSADNRRAARVELNAWRYTERLIEQLDPGYDPARADFRG